VPVTLSTALDRVIDHVGATVAPEARARLLAWLEAASAWNKKLDLTAASTEAALVEVLALDAITIAHRVPLAPGMRCLDVGTGAGTPGLALALLRDDLGPMLLIEPLAKRAAFLRTVIGSAGAERRIRVTGDKLDPERPALDDGARAFLGGEPDLAMSRATFAPEIWARVGLSIAPRALLMLVDALPSLPAGAAVEHEVRYRLPSSGAPRLLAVIRRGG
jgi:16S rRNA (guanine527-N7)-methyltransferase